MYRVTTPTHTFKLPMNTDYLKEIQIVYKQGGLKLIKHYENGVLPSGMSLGGKTVVIRLTQEETKAFDARYDVAIQVRVLTADDDAFASQIFTVKVENVLNEEVLADE